MSNQSDEYPESGQMVLVRQRPALVREVFQKSDPETSIVNHLIDVEYIDGWNFPKEDHIIWEREINPKILSKSDLPDINPISQPDQPQRFDAFLNSMRWSTLNRIYISPE